jgi:hypothetical protein
METFTPTSPYGFVDDIDYGYSYYDYAGAAFGLVFLVLVLLFVYIHLRSNRHPCLVLVRRGQVRKVKGKMTEILRGDILYVVEQFGVQDLRVSWEAGRGLESVRISGADAPQVRQRLRNIMTTV